MRPRSAPSSGMQQRGDLLIEALGGLGEVDVLLYPPARSAVEPERAEGDLRVRWEAVRRVDAIPQDPPPASRWHWHAGPLLAPRSHAWAATSKPAHVAGLESVSARGFDLALAHGVGAMQPFLLSRAPRPPVYFDMNDIPHRLLLRRQRMRSGLGRLSACLRLPSLLWVERRMASVARRTFVCSDLDARYLGTRWRLPRISVVPNAVAIPPRAPVPAEPRVLFVGTLDYPPNTEAAELLATRIWPLVRRERPDATLRIVGRAPERVPCSRCPPDNVTFTGYVEDLSPVYRDTRLVCAPIRVGAGTRVKLVEAAANGRPIVATSLGAEGLNLRHGREILLADRPRELAAHCVRLLRDHAECRRLGEAARGVAERHFGREQAVDGLRRLLTSDQEERRVVRGGE
jgi:glycosyltransferase involved in cell wall biosynthesis